MRDNLVDDRRSQQMKAQCKSRGAKNESRLHVADYAIVTGAKRPRTWANWDDSPNEQDRLGLNCEAVIGCNKKKLRKRSLLNQYIILRIEQNRLNVLSYSDESNGRLYRICIAPFSLDQSARKDYSSKIIDSDK